MGLYSMVRITPYLLVVLIVVSVVSANTSNAVQVFDFHSFEECYGESTSTIATVHDASLRIVQSPSHRLGAQFSLNATFHEPINNAIVKYRLWHEVSGDRYKYEAVSACCGFFENEHEDQCSSDSGRTHCPLHGNKSGMLERLFVEEREGNWEAELRVYALDEEGNRGRELVCVAVPFFVSPDFLTQFHKERKEK